MLLANMSRQEFLFAVARGVQRNKNLMYSGVFVDCKKFLFAVARGVQRNGDLYESRLKREVFLFAVARGVQRNTSGKNCGKKKPKFLFAVARGVQRNPTPSGEAVTSTNDVRFHTRRSEARSHGHRTPLQGAFVLVRGLHTRGAFRCSSRQPLVTQVTCGLTIRSPRRRRAARGGRGVSWRLPHNAAQ